MNFYIDLLFYHVGSTATSSSTQNRKFKPEWLASSTFISQRWMIFFITGPDAPDHRPSCSVKAIAVRSLSIAA